MKTGFSLGDFELFWLNGGRFELDGGAMFGVVPKVLWARKYPSSADNTIPMVAWPLLVKTRDSLILIETGLGNKLTEKQRQIFRVKEAWNLVADLESLGIKREDIDYVILTHYDFDHAGGVVMKEDSGALRLTFPRAKHIVQKKEWDDVLNPNKRSLNTFWPINYEALKESKNLELVDGEEEVRAGVRVILTGGHNRGFQIVKLESGNGRALHMVDLLPTHAHFNPLWIMAYDNFPLESIAKKEEWEKRGIEEGAWFTFYHDPFVLACKFDEKGNIIEKHDEGDASQDL
ncbi:MAG: MBL fold metallo-hydrolase [Thermodesulfovibrionales bacterium]|jgi:glyoxylase-like metal-dependent hydrolase (beta-lactamase superfamily II)